MEAETQESAEMHALNCKPTILNVEKMSTGPMSIDSRSSKWQC
jgi:hypothetical protein